MPLHCTGTDLKIPHHLCADLFRLRPETERSSLSNYLTGRRARITGPHTARASGCVVVAGDVAVSDGVLGLRWCHLVWHLCDGLMPACARPCSLARPCLGAIASAFSRCSLFGIVTGVNCEDVCGSERIYETKFLQHSAYQGPMIVNITNLRLPTVIADAGRAHVGMWFCRQRHMESRARGASSQGAR